MEEKKKKGFFSSLFAPKSKGCCCNIQFEEVSQDVNANKVDPKNTNNENTKPKDNQVTGNDCGC